MIPQNKNNGANILVPYSMAAWIDAINKITKINRKTTIPKVPKAPNSYNSYQKDVTLHRHRILLIIKCQSIYQTATTLSSVNISKGALSVKSKILPSVVNPS